MIKRSRPQFDAKVMGQNLKRLRKKHGYSVKDIHKYLQLTPQAIYKYESGRGYPQADTLLLLMDLYGANVNDIIRNHNYDFTIEYKDSDSVIDKVMRSERLRKYWELLMRYGRVKRK